MSGEVGAQVGQAARAVPGLQSLASESPAARLDGVLPSAAGTAPVAPVRQAEPIAAEAAGTPVRKVIFADREHEILDRAATRVDFHSQIGGDRFPFLFSSKECVVSVRPLVSSDERDLANGGLPLPADALRVMVWLLRYTQSDGSWRGVGKDDTVRVVSGAVDVELSVRGQGEHYSVVSFTAPRGLLGHSLKLYVSPAPPASPAVPHQPSAGRPG